MNASNKDKRVRVRGQRIMVSVPMTVEERDLLQQASAVTGIPQATFLKEAGLEMAGRKMWEALREEAAGGTHEIWPKGAGGVRKAIRGKSAAR